MLQYSTVQPATLVLLKRLIKMPQLVKFCLVGGTNLSLRFGHRISIDIDLFSSEDFDPIHLENLLMDEFPSTLNTFRSTSIGLFATIDEVKVDLIKHHHHPCIFDPETIDEIRLLDERDIAAMKINTILKRGQKKDFFDLYEIFKKYTLSEVISFYELKYPSQYLMISIPQALIYFDDANESQDPVSLNNTTWEQVKANLRGIVNEYLK